MTISLVLNVFTCKLPHKLQGCFSLAWWHWQHFCCCSHQLPGRVSLQTSQASRFGPGEFYGPYIQHDRGWDLDYEHPEENVYILINAALCHISPDYSQTMFTTKNFLYAWAGYIKFNFLIYLRYFER